MLNPGDERGVEVYLREIGKLGILTPDQEADLAGRIKSGDLEARALMIRSNLDVVVEIAQVYAGRGVALLDLISDGNIALMESLTGYEPAKDGRFRVYAGSLIAASIRRKLAA